jgi:hypothetical protein
MRNKPAWFDSVEVYDPADGELVGYTLIKRSQPTNWQYDDITAPPQLKRVNEGDPRIVNPVTSTRSTAWTYLEDAR